MQLILKQVAVHNLKKVSLTLEPNQLIVFTGVSGSGKSSLAFDTIFVEGQRRYIESLSVYARRFLGNLPKPDALSITGIPPTIAIEQKSTGKNPRSTVSTMTGIYDYLRVLYARLGEAHCPISGDKVSPISQKRIADTILAYPVGSKIILLAPFVKGKKGAFKEELVDLLKKGFTRLRADGTFYHLAEEMPSLDKGISHNIDIVIDRLTINEENRIRIAEAIEIGLGVGKGIITVLQPDTNQEELFSEHAYSEKSGLYYSPLEPEDFSFNHPKGMCESCQGLGGDCPSCRGARIKSYPAATTFKGKKIHELAEMMISEVVDFFNTITLSEVEQKVGSELLAEIKGRLGFLMKVGLHYLTLSRTAPTLSGGESQRVRLASQIGFSLVGCAYILDEPSIGLHPRDNKKLLQTLELLRDKGNTVIVVEHDEETICAADHIVDVGPLAGVEGGEIIASGGLNEILAAKESVTGAYLRGERSISIPKKRRKPTDKKLIIKDVTHHNLKKVTVEIPLGLFIAVTGVSGSGKSSLITDVLYPALANEYHKAALPVGKHAAIEGKNYIDKIIPIDQSPIGRTPRSNLATYVKIFDEIRDLFAELPESRAFGYKPGRFSFNVKEGSCIHCGGMGMVRIDMDFLEDEWTTCTHCKGKRFDAKTLAVKYRDKSIHDILEMSVEEASLFFKELAPIRRKLEFCREVGLGYIRLGQSATTLSGGEAQRIKLAKELIRPATGKTIYLLDEPTTGLHFYDIHKLIDILQSLVQAGNTVLVIEHNMDLVKTVDHVIDLGPEGGNGGGRILGSGTPEEIAKLPTPTGIFLKEALERKPLKSAPKKSAKKTKEIDTITVRGASQNNLKDVSLEIPRGKISVFTGPSGSGKTSLAFETIYAEGQSRYVDSLSSHAKSFIKKLPKPKLEEITGLSPALSIEQKKHAGNPRSTLGTMTEVYDFLRIIFARMGTPYDPETGEKIQSITPAFILQKLSTLQEGTKLQILAPIKIKRGEEFSHLKSRFQQQGYLRIRLNGVYYELDQEIPYDRHLNNKLELVIDRILYKQESAKRIMDAIDAAAILSENTVIIAGEEGDLFYNLSFAVESTGKSYPPITPHTFSFNSEEGMCQECFGLGLKWGANLKGDRTILKYTPFDFLTLLLKDFATYKSFQLFETVLRDMGINPHTPFKELKEDKLQIFFEGANTVIEYEDLEFRWIGIHNMLIRLSKMGKGVTREEILPFLYQSTCPLCNGSRLNPLARAVRINGISLPELCQMPLSEVRNFVGKLKGEHVLAEALTYLKNRLDFLCDIGLDYLSLDRSAPTLSGGEVQRVALARQLGSGLTGVLYVLDEPTIALHPHNNHLLNIALKKLKNLGNTLILVEHDPMTIQIADKIYDFGPGSGNLGGTITAFGTPSALKKNSHSLTGAYLSGRKKIPIPSKRRVAKDNIFIEHAKKHNLKDISLSIPTNVMTCITGVSGSGKSTLVHDVLLPALSENLNRRTPKNVFTYDNTTFTNLDLFDSAIVIDQSPIGRTVRANVITYTDFLTPLRAFFSALPAASAKGLLPKHFSFNHSAGLCKKCRGLGYQIVELQFMPPVSIDCEACHGNRLNPVSLSVTYKGKNLGQILKLTVRAAKEFLPPIPKITKILDRLIQVGLDYLTLGQEVQTLSGGEASRLRLSRELAKPSTKHTLYLFDEPTVGLHSDDIAKLLPIFHSLVNKGNTLIIVEHNLDIIASADHIIDLGPEGGNNGGHLITSGTPEEVARHPTSHTAHYLKPLLYNH